MCPLMRSVLFLSDQLPKLQQSGLSKSLRMQTHLVECLPNCILAHFCDGCFQLILKFSFGLTFSFQQMDLALPSFIFKRSPFSKQIRSEVILLSFSNCPDRHFWNIGDLSLSLPMTTMVNQHLTKFLKQLFYLLHCEHPYTY